MPTYEYKCTQCEAQFDLWQSVGSTPPACPECAGVTKKIFRPVSIIFKGSGFYLTDKRAESGKGEKSEQAEKAADGGETKTEVKADAKTETKADAKTETKSESKPEKAESSKPKVENGKPSA